MVGIIGKKIGMTRLQVGKNILPCTVVHAPACVVTQLKNLQKDGYNAVQLGAWEKKEKHTTKPLLNHFKKALTSPKQKLAEFKNFQAEFAGEKTIELGTEITLDDIFEEEEMIDVQGTSKGKGTQGVVKRHGFKGVGDQTHGQHNRERAPGAIGGASYPSRVFKGMRMAGRMGHDLVTQQNLKVIKIISEENLIILLGSVPGPKNSFVILKK